MSMPTGWPDPLIQPSVLEQHLQRPVDLEAATSAIQVAAGWLSAATRLAALPTPLPVEVHAWAVELAALAFEYPILLTSRRVGNEAETGAAARRAEILAEAKSRYAGAGSPRGSFPHDGFWSRGVTYRDVT